MIKKPKNLPLAIKGFLIACLIATTWSGQVEAKEEVPFKLKPLPSEKCILQKDTTVADPVLKCLHLKSSVVPDPSPTKPGDPRPVNQQLKSMQTSPNEMQTVLDWCKNKSGTWTSDGKDGGSCGFSLANANCKANGQVWDGGTGQGGCTGPRTGSQK